MSRHIVYLYYSDSSSAQPSTNTEFVPFPSTLVYQTIEIEKLSRTMLNRTVREIVRGMRTVINFRSEVHVLGNTIRDLDSTNRGTGASVLNEFIRARYRWITVDDQTPSHAVQVNVDGDSIDISVTGMIDKGVTVKSVAII